MRLGFAVTLLFALFFLQPRAVGAVMAYGDYALAALALLLTLAAAVFVLSTVYSVVCGAPYVPMSHKKVRAMLDLAHLKPGDKLADLGSGDGRIVIEAAKRGITAEGWEISPFLWAYSTWNIWRLGLSDRAHIHFGSYWPESMGQFDVITLYLVSTQMGNMQKKLLRELPPGSRVLSYSFSFPTWEHDTRDGLIKRYVTA